MAGYVTMMSFAIKIFVNAIAIWVATVLVDGVDLGDGSTGDNIITLLIVAVVFGVVNAVIKPLVALLSLPLYVVTLGLFTFVVNAFMLWLTSWISEQLGQAFIVTGFVAALLGALVVTLVSFVLNLIIPDGD
ncbi:MAG: phage holin family protein [Carbonactinosporaceae bacterium]